MDATGGINENEHVSGEKNEEAECSNDINHSDRVSSVRSQRSSRKGSSHRSYVSGVSSARLRAKAGKAALQRRQELEDEKTKARNTLRKRKEQIELDAQIELPLHNFLCWKATTLSVVRMA